MGRLRDLCIVGQWATNREFGSVASVNMGWRLNLPGVRSEFFGLGFRSKAEGWLIHVLGSRALGGVGVA